ncbi:conserved hypothetical protein [Bacillus mycoides]|uniref:Uncharacterized protein n=1 Tax=Bacillus mycoides TaxID=1405 RepID=A0A653VZ82_BACMY|nr:conserved hypothetical protein [Bacillus mycoides]
MGGVPEAVAVFVSAPESTSAWVVVYVAVNVRDAPGASDATDAGEIAPRVPVPEKSASSTVTPRSVTFPVFVALNEYVIDCPALVIC